MNYLNCIVFGIVFAFSLSACNKKKSLEEIKSLEAYYDGIIVGIKDLSINVNLYLEVDDINNLDTTKEVFVALNKNMHNKDLDVLEKTMKSLKNIKGVLYYDAAVVAFYNEIKPDYDLVWSQEHMTTSSVTCNYWKSKGVNYTYLSTDITLDEILNILSYDNTNQNLLYHCLKKMKNYPRLSHLLMNIILMLMERLLKLMPNHYLSHYLL